VGLHVCTAVAANYLPQARVLADSVRRHHSGARVWALVAGPAPRLRQDEPFELLMPAGVGIPDAELARRALAYPVQELVSSLKPALAAAALRAAGGDPVLLLDSDVLVCGDLGGVAEQAARHAVLLSPHAPFPLPHVPGGPSVEERIAQAGVFNGGFLGVSPGAEPFLEWWGERCARDCVLDLERGIVMSQTWLQFAPALADAGVLRDPGCNVLLHNLFERDVWRGADGSWRIGGDPLRFYHFAGFDPQRPERMARTEPLVDWQTFRARPGVAALTAEYVGLLREAGLATDGRVEPWGSALPDGTPVGMTMRRAYLDALIASERDAADRPPNPLTSGDSAAFLAWLREPAPGMREASRYLVALHARRADLRGAFPDVPGKHEPWLVDWAGRDLEAQDSEWASVRAAPAAQHRAP
jgi:hypothetical protein